ncbi:unnamed protein product [Withania somnifera]
MANLSHFLTSKFKKVNLYYVAATIVLCCTFYVIGLWPQGADVTSRQLSSTAIIPCKPSIKNTKNPNYGSSISINFTARHTADSLVPLSPSARVIHFPSCNPNLSEYTPCEDLKRSLKFDRNMLAYRERHCPEKQELLKCRIPAPFGYKQPFRWPESRDSVWYANVPHKHLTVEKAGQNWVRFKGDRFTFPGGGTMFPRGADAYIDDIGKLIKLKDGSIRTAIDTGCGVASWGAYLLSRDILPISFAPKDTHEAQVQFSLERGVPAQIGILATNRLPYPARAFDMAHCSRCLIPWGKYDHWRGWNRTADDLKAEQDQIESVARSLCWKKVTQKGDLAIWQKPTNHVHCKINRRVFRKPPFCQEQDPDQAWYTKIDACLSPLPEVSNVRDVAGGRTANWPERLTAIPPRVASSSIEGVTAEGFSKDTELWKKRVAHYKVLDSQLAERGRHRNILDMNAWLGGFAAALVDDPVWVMNAIPVEADVNTLGVIYERGLIGTYQSWCEAMSTYPRTYDFIHADSVFTLYQDRCEMEDILLEMDRVLRPQGSVIFRDDVDVLVNVKSIVDGLQWDSRMVDHEGGPLVREKLLIATKQYWTAPAPDQDKQ